MEVQIHPTAIVDRTAVLCEGVEIGPGAVVGPDCLIGARCRLGPRAVVIRNTVMGVENHVHSGAVLGGDPQDRKYNPGAPGSLIIGDSNIFRENATISRGTGEEHPTRVGDRCYLMANTHIAHNCIVGDAVTMVNNSSLAGHARVHSGVTLSGNSGVHQFCTIGEMAMLQAGAIATMHVPPFVIVANGVNTIAGLNRVGLLRSKRFTREQCEELKQAYRLLYRGRDERTMSHAMAVAFGRNWGGAAAIFLSFVREMLIEAPPRLRGICGPRRNRKSQDPALDPIVDA